MKSGIFRFVRYDDVPAYERLGWFYYKELPLPHWDYACLMRWLCECSVVEPMKGGQNAAR